MTTISLILISSDRLCGFTIKGHVGYAPEGQDIVCSALSFLSITCANALERIAKVNPKMKMDRRKGHLSVHVDQEALNAQADIIFQLFEMGVKDLQNEYPDYLTIKQDYL